MFDKLFLLKNIQSGPPEAEKSVRILISMRTVRLKYFQETRTSGYTILTYFHHCYFVCPVKMQVDTVCTCREWSRRYFFLEKNLHLRHKLKIIIMSKLIPILKMLYRVFPTTHLN